MHTHTHTHALAHVYFTIIVSKGSAPKGASYIRLTIIHYIVHIVAHSKLYLLSCGADKSIMFWVLDRKTDREREACSFQRSANKVEKYSMYDMVVDPTMTHVGLVGQDKMLR